MSSKLQGLQYIWLLHGLQLKAGQDTCYTAAMLTVTFVPLLHPGVHAYMGLHMITHVCMPIVCVCKIVVCIAVCRQAGAK